MRGLLCSNRPGSGEPAAPRRQSLLRSQARCALLPAATPRLTFVVSTFGWLETPRGQRDGASEPAADPGGGGAAWTRLEAQRVPAGAARGSACPRARRGQGG